MTSEVVVDVQSQKISIALLEDKRLVEFQQESKKEQYGVGNIYLAKVRKIMPGLNSCFVNIGYERDAFLHYLDLGLHYRSLKRYLKLLGEGNSDVPITRVLNMPDLEKDGSIQNLVDQQDEVLVQIQKEPISTKGPRISCDISFPGRLLVLLPFSDKVLVSSKIKSNQERARLKQLILSIKPQGFGVIIRTVAKEKKASELDAELQVLLKSWEDTIDKVKQAKREQSIYRSQVKNIQQIQQNYKATLCFEETSRTVALLRDLFNTSYENIYVNDKSVYNEIKKYLVLIAPDRKDVVKLYTGILPIFDNFSITKQIKSSFGKTITYKHGAYLIIEHTEALHVIDVNSGNRSRSEDGQEQNALDVNIGATDEIARQLRLRDMGGIIVVDFIDMALPENRQKIYERMVENMKKDRARHNILPLSKFGLMQITRQRVRPIEEPNVEESCPTCGGKGTIKPSLLFIDFLESKIEYLVNKLNYKKLVLFVHPFIEAYLKQGFVSLKYKWMFKYKLRKFNIICNQDFSYLEYKFEDEKGYELQFNRNKEIQ